MIVSFPRPLEKKNKRRQHWSMNPFDFIPFSFIFLSQGDKNLLNKRTEIMKERNEDEHALPEGIFFFFKGKDKVFDF